MKQQLMIFSMIALAGPFAMASDIGPAGCGLGNQQFKKENQIFAATLNATGVQTFGILSGTSGCVDGSSSMAQMASFVEANRVALSNEAARGQGETVETLSVMLGCPDTQALGETLKTNYREIFEANGENSIGISKSIRGAVSKNPGLQRSCQKIS